MATAPGILPRSSRLGWGESSLFDFRVLFGLGVCLLVAGCDRQGRNPESKMPAVIGEASPHHDVESPMELVRRARVLRLAGRLDDLGAVVDPRQSRHVVSLLYALDRLELANRSLALAVKKQFGTAVAREFDHRALVNAAGVFSRDVELISQRIDGDRATVTFQIAKRVPLEEVRLVRLDGDWRIRTDDPIPEATREIGRLAEGLTAVARLVGRGNMTVAKLRSELHWREAPIGRRLAELAQNGP